MSGPSAGAPGPGAQAGEIVMPRLSDTMEEGTILRWLKRDGEQVQRGEELVEIETDKATMVYESDVTGTLTLIAAEGETLPVGQPIARVGDRASAAADAAQPAADAGSSQETGVEADRATAPIADGDAALAAAAGDPAAQAAGTGDGEGGRIKASPLARRIARREGIDLATISGTGPGGRIVKADVGAGAQPSSAASPGDSARAVEPLAAPSSPQAPTGDAVATAKGATTEVELNRLQQAVARRMAESKATIPDFAMALDVEMDACVALRSELKRLAATGAEFAPTYNDMIVKACALALREHPKANGSYRDGKLQLFARVNVGVAVAAEGALVVPTVFDADSKALGEIARETRALAERVRAATITPPELGGGTFTVSNLGMFGIRSFTAIINPPQAAIMSVGALEARAVVAEDGAILARQMLTLTLVCDHRILFGAEAARFLARVRELLQTPSSLTL
jgi:pyruvate dehydrogenase E2 component (dihydrolipoamide acetyltransferase)